MSGCGRDNKVEAELNQGGVRIPRERHKYTARRGDRTRRSEVMKIVSGKNAAESERGVEIIKSQESEIADISSVEVMKIPILINEIAFEWHETRC
jgi:ethanolamine utilization microcompartment shell protein EutL